MTMKAWPRTYQELWCALVVVIVSLLSTSCIMIGPDYVRPSAPIATDWRETNEPAVKHEPAEISTWWTVFQDSVLNTLVETAYRQNPSLRAAGVRVLEAQAQGGSLLASCFLSNRRPSGPSVAMTSARIRQTVTRLVSRPRSMIGELA